jgi:hypothetical protein
VRRWAELPYRPAVSDAPSAQVIEPRAELEASSIFELEHASVAAFASSQHFCVSGSPGLRTRAEQGVVFAASKSQRGARLSEHIA